MPVTDHRAATERTLRLAVLAWSAAWLITFAPRLLGPTSWTTSPAMTTLLASVVVVCWLASALTGLSAGAALVPSLGASVTVQAWATTDTALVGSDPMLTAWAVTACVAAGLVYPRSWAWRSIAAVAAALTVVLIARASITDVVAEAWPTVVAVVGYALATGLAATIAASTLRRAAGGADADETAVLARGRAVAVAAAHRSEGERVTRVLHDTVINTLGALRRGVPATGADRARMRCREDLARIADLTGPASDAPPQPPGPVSDQSTTSPPAGTCGSWPVPLGRSLAIVSLQVGVLLTGLCGMLTAATWSDAPAPTSLLALGILAAVLALLAVVGLRRHRTPLPWPAAAALVAATLAVTTLPGIGDVGCRALGLAWWAPTGGMTVLIGLTLLTQGVVWPLLGGVFFTVGTMSIYVTPKPVPVGCIDAPVSVITYHVAVLVAIVVFRQGVLRLWDGATRAREEAARIDVAAAVIEARQQARLARLAGVRATTVPLLRDIEAGDLDLGDPDVRNRCGLEEEALRGLLQIDAGNGWLGDDLAAAVLQAHATGRQIRITAAPAVPLPDQTGRPVLRDTLHDAIASLPASGTATLALLPAGERGGELMLVSDIAPDRAVDAATADPNTVVHGLAVGRETLDGQELVWIRWPA